MTQNLYQLSAGYGFVSLGVDGTWYNPFPNLPGSNRATQAGLCDGFDAVYVGSNLIPSVYSSHYNFSNWVEEPLPSAFPCLSMASSPTAMIVLHSVGGSNDGSFSYKSQSVPAWTLGNIGGGYYSSSLINSGFIYKENAFRCLGRNGGFAGWYSLHTDDPSNAWVKNPMTFTPADPSLLFPAYFTTLCYVGGDGVTTPKWIAAYGDGSLWTSLNFIHWTQRLAPGSFGATPANCVYIVSDENGNALAAGQGQPVFMFRTRDFGEHWENVSANVPVGGGGGKTFEIMAYSPQTTKYYNGEYSTLDLGDSWQMERLTYGVRYSRFDGLLNDTAPPAPPIQPTLIPRGVGHYTYTDPRSFIDSDKPK